MKFKRKFLYYILLIILITGLTGNNVMVYGVTADSPEDIIQERLNGAVVIYSGSMYSLVDNQLQVIDPANELITPFIQNSRTLVPIRFIAESFGAEVSWDQTTQTAMVVIDSKVVKIKIYSTKMTVNGKDTDLDVPAMLTGDRTFIPLRAVGEALGKEVFYDRGLVVISNTANIFDTVNEKELIDNIIDTVNILPTIGTREKLVGMLRNT